MSTDSIEDSPYRPPETSSEPTDGCFCPSCGAEMTSGELAAAGNIVWRTKERSLLTRMLREGELIGPTRSGLGYRTDAWRCVACRLYLLPEHDVVSRVLR